MKLYLFGGLLASATLCLAQAVAVKAGIDGKGGVEHNVLVTIEGSRITHVGPAGRDKPTYDLSALTLTPGWTDLVAAEGNPLEDITAVRRAAFVMKGGRVVKYDPRKE